jgi:hypothetical protein
MFQRLSRVFQRLRRACFSAKGAEYDSQGQARAKRVRRPWVRNIKNALRPERPKYRKLYYALSGCVAFLAYDPGATSRQSRDLPLVLTFRAFGARPST